MCGEGNFGEQEDGEGKGRRSLEHRRAYRTGVGDVLGRKECGKRCFVVKLDHWVGECELGSGVCVRAREGTLTVQSKTEPAEV